MLQAPLFGDPSNGDFQLAQASPCLGTGEGGADIGAFSYGCVTVDVDEDDDILPYSFELYQNYPNPFNPETKMEFSLPVRSNVRICIYNLLGQELARLVDQELSAGLHQVCWGAGTNSGVKASTGICFFRVEADDFVETRKTLLLQ